MGMKGAVAPWNTLGARRRGRPRKEPAESSGPGGCVWPEMGGRCRGELEHGLALCTSHGTILSRGWQDTGAGNLVPSGPAETSEPGGSPPSRCTPADEGLAGADHPGRSCRPSARSGRPSKPGWGAADTHVSRAHPFEYKGDGCPGGTSFEPLRREPAVWWRRSVGPGDGLHEPLWGPMGRWDGRECGI